MITSLRPDKHVSGPWRGGQVWTLDGATSTIKLLAEAHIVRMKTVTTSLIPVDAQSIGCPVACRVDGDGADTYTIAEVVGSAFGADAPRDNARSVAAGTFSPGIIPRHIHGEPRLWWSEGEA